MPNDVKKTLVAPGELRADMLELFDAEPHLDILLSAPGLLPRPPDGHSRLARAPHDALSAQAAFAHRRALLEAFGNELDALPQTPQWEERIRGWVQRLGIGEARVLHYPAGPLFSRLISRADASVVPAVPLTKALLGRPAGTELDLSLTGPSHLDARAWFERHAREADDISPEVKALLEATWAGALVEPGDVYFKVLQEYFAEMLDSTELADSNRMLAVMTDFQQAAYHQAKSILRRFGGVFLADVVGLGKTYIAMALLLHLQEQYGQEAVVIAPPAVCGAWEELAEEFGVHVRVVSSGKIDELAQCTQREVLVIDESHNFRNPATRRYERIWEWLHPGGLPSRRKVLLLSATPQNNTSRDVLQQMKLFPDNFVRLPFPGESLEAYFKMVEAGRESLTTVLQHVVVRRTRGFIQAQYPDARLRVRNEAGQYEMVPVRFPKRVSGEAQCLRYRIEEAYGEGLYDRIMASLGRMEFALHGLGGFILEMHAKDPRIVGQRQAGHSLRGLFKVLLLKRLESSETAFRVTLQRFAERLQGALDNLRQGFVLVTTEVEEEGGVGESMPLGMFHRDRLEAALRSDYAQVSDMLAAMAQRPLYGEPKLERLKAYLRARPPCEHRTLIFTQFSDTADFLCEHLRGSGEFGRVARVTGSSGGARSIARRFAPRANRADDVRAEDEIDLLIATDAFSEGVNLQDADTLINYDLHWNPVRLIQRAGRIDRLGSPNAEIHVASFLPERALEQNLGIEQVVRRRIREFLAVFGEDSHVLPSDERLDESEAVDAYAGRAFEKEEQADEMDGFGRHSERIFALRRRERSRYERIRAQRPGRRAATASALPGTVATRMGRHWAFWRAGAEGLEKMADLAGLDLLYRHTRSASVDEATAAAAAPQLAALVEAAKAQFALEAGRIREQRLSPALDHGEEWLRSALEAYKARCEPEQRDKVDEMLRWVLAGQYKASLRPAIARWRKEQLKDEALYQQMLPMLRFPLREEPLEGEQVVGTVVGIPGPPQRG